MCCRCVMVKTLEDVIDWAEIEEMIIDIDELEPNYNVAPAQRLPVVATLNGLMTLTLMTWGFPARTGSGGGHSIFNARVESLSRKPTFKPLLRDNRCLVLCDGYYEWRQSGGHKQPYLIYRPQRTIMPMAGLWTYGEDDGGSLNFTVVTRPPRPDIAFIHDRMPLLLNREQGLKWVNGPLNEVTKSFPRFKAPLSCHPVSTYVNSPRHNSPKCVEKVTEMNNGGTQLEFDL